MYTQFQYPSSLARVRPTPPPLAVPFNKWYYHTRGAQVRTMYLGTMDMAFIQEVVSGPAQVGRGASEQARTKNV